MADVKRMSEQQLADVVADYAGAFPGWLPFRGQAFFRDTMPIRQMIWFEPMSTTRPSPYYRPACGLRSMIMPTSRMLHFVVGERFQPTLTQHPARWRDVVYEMERVFAPDIRMPVDVAQVTALCATEERDENQNDLVMMAILHAWLGNRDDARRRCIRLLALPASDHSSMLRLDKEARTFALELIRSLETESEREFLENTAQANRNRPELLPA